MAGLLLGASSSLPDYFNDVAQAKSKTMIASFDRELGYLLGSLKKASKNSGDEEFIQKTSNSIFNLWNNYESKLPPHYFAQQLLALGDLLYRNEYYSLASTHCYGRYLAMHRGTEERLQDIVATMIDSEYTVALLQAIIGDAMCQFYVVEKRDPKMTYTGTIETALTVLGYLQQVSQAALLREPLYWLAYNAIVHIYSISRTMMSFAYCDKVLEYLLWSAVCMESSVPLMASKYIRVRVNLYIAVCQCYNDLHLPQQAELFARGGLNKVHELAELESSSASEPTETSELVYREVSVKLGVIVFKRSVFVSRKKIKPGFRPKVRPTIKELLQLPSPRSPTEKLLSDMFTGLSGQFLAILETLSDSSHRLLQEGPPPSPIGTDLDQETITDVYQELFCVGTDLAFQALEGNAMSQSTVEPHTSLLDSTVKSGDGIPLDTVVLFVRLAYSYEQKDIVEMLVDRVIQETQVSDSPIVRSKGKTLELLQMIDSLMAVFKKYKTALTSVPATIAPGPPNTATTVTSTATGVQQTASEIKTECVSTAEELFSKLQQVLSLLHFLCADLILLATDYDLLLDATVLVWEIARPAFSGINSHEYNSCKQFLTHTGGNQYMVFLNQLVEVFHSLEVWRVDPFLLGELCIKLGCLHEAKAQLKHPNSMSCTLVKLPTEDESFILEFDRSQLLVCLAELERGLKCVELAKKDNTLDARPRSREGEGREVMTELDVLHAELVYAITRVRLKLASTIPPPLPSEGTHKPSSLKSKVAERKERQIQRERMLSELTAPTVSVPSVADLKERCGQSHYKMAILLMLQASSEPQINQASTEALMKECYSHLVKEGQRSTVQPPSASSTLPPPVLLWSTDTSLAFKPRPFSDELLQDQVFYYKLYGRVATGSNVKVRLSDKHLPGLGLEVRAGTGDCTLTVHGLQPNEEYVFAVAGYSKSGQLIGGTIGQITGQILSSYLFPLLTAWGYFCQHAYVAGINTLAEKASEVLWDEFVAPQLPTSKLDHSMDNTYQPFELKKSTLASIPQSIVRHFVQSILIRTQLKMGQSALFSDKLSRQGPLKPSQLQRIELAKSLVVAMEVSAMLNDASLCLQAVVMTYGVLAPLIQHSVTARPVIDILLHCYCVIGEVPETLVSNKQTDNVIGVHHMIAGIAYYLGKVTLGENKKALFSLLTDNVRGLLLATMPAPTTKPKEKESHTSTSKGALHQPSLLSGSHDLSMSSYSTITSGLPNLVPQTGGGRKKKGRKKLAASADEIADESKSVQFKAFEGFLLSNYTHMSESLDLTGQEDPMILHAVIATQTSQTAYREVKKFRKRPQYLEFFAHLASSTLAKGHVEWVMEWSKDAFHWLTRRNELLLSSKAPPPGQQKHDNKANTTGKQAVKQQAKKTPRTMSRIASTCGSSLDLVPVRKQTKKVAPRTMSRVMSAACGSSMNVAAAKKQSKGSGGAVSLGASLNLPRPFKKGASLAPTAALAKFSPNKLRKLQPIMSTKVLELSLDVKITREDIETKAVLVLISLLPGMWRKHKARRRLRAVCSVELPWRVQANLIQATCCMELLNKRMVGNVKKEGVTEEILGLSFDTAEFLIDGVIPIHPQALAGQVENETNTKTSARPSTTSTLLSLILNDLHQMMVHYTRAITLSHRGQYWVLLQNASRSLWNAISYLNQACSKLTCDSQQKASLLGAVYGKALSPLCFAASGLIDMLLHSEVGVSGSSLPQASSLQFTPRIDDCNTVGLLFVKRLVFLTVHVLYVHQHWEKAVSIIMRFDDITNHTWAEQLVPVLTSAQTKLADRVSRHRGAVTRDNLEPAAHLDPGPDGYNVYGRVGHALGLVSVPLDIDSSLKRLAQCDDSPPQECGKMLSHARRLLTIYLGGQKLAPFSAHDHGSMLHTPSPAVRDTLLSDVFKAYDQAIEELVARGDVSLSVQAMNELGDIFLDTHTKSASQWWSEALCVVLQNRDPLNTWRTSLLNALATAGLWGCLLAAMIASKLARYEYRNELDIRLEYTLMSASLYKTALSYSLPTPSSDYDFADYQPPRKGDSSIFPGVEVFSDTFRCPPLAMLSSLQWCGEELISRRHAVKALPVLWLFQYLSHSVCRDIQYTVRARVLKLQALTQLHKYEESLLLLSELLVGVGLPQISSEGEKHVDTHWVFPGFSNNLPLSDPKNTKCVHSIVDKALSASLVGLYGRENVCHLSLARAQLYTALAESFTSLHTTPVISRTHEQSAESSRPPTSYSLSVGSTLSLAPGSSPSASTLQVGGRGSASGSPRSTTVSLPPSNRRGRQDIKHVLLDHAEKYLSHISTRQTEDSTIRTDSNIKIQALLELARVALSYEHRSTAVQLSLAALRTMQQLCSKSYHEMRLWLLCKTMLARSLVGNHMALGSSSSLLDCSVQCEEGIKQCEAVGDVELAAELHYIAALHLMSVEPCQLETVTINCQRTLELLESLPVLSPHTALLRCHASLLLADVSCVAGVSGMETEMVDVFHGLGTMIKEQITCGSRVQDEATPNIYLPHRALLASCNLRLAHALCLRAVLKSANVERDVQSALTACEEGIALLKNSSQSDPCLMAELLVQQGWLWSVSTNEGHASISCLLEASRAIAECGVDPRLAVSTYYKLAELFVAFNKQSTHLDLTGDDNLPVSQSFIPPVSPNSPNTVRKRSVADSSRKSSRGSSKSREQSSKAKRDLKGKLAFSAWCLVKLALRATNTLDNLKRFVSEVHNEEATKTLPQKVIADLPDFAVLELCPSEQLVGMLTSSLDVPPVEALLPSTQSAVTSSVNLFKVAGYFSKLTKQCTWQKSSLSLSNSNWQLHHYALTPSVYPKAKALLAFLTTHSPIFPRSCKLPWPPLSVFPLKSTPPSAPTTESYLTAGETELTAVWMSSFPLLIPNISSQLVTEQRIVGYFAMNAKAVHTQSTVNSASLGTEVYIVQTTVKGLEDVYGVWEELAASTKAYVDARATTRPISRSPSKQKKSEKAMKVPQEVVERLHSAIELLRETFDIKVNELPKVDLSSVCQIAKVLQPFSQSTVRGDAYYFFKSLFGSSVASN